VSWWLQKWPVCAASLLPVCSGASRQVMSRACLADCLCFCLPFGLLLCLSPSRLAPHWHRVETGPTVLLAQLSLTNDSHHLLLSLASPNSTCCLSSVVVRLLSYPREQASILIDSASGNRPVSQEEEQTSSCGPRRTRHILLLLLLFLAYFSSSSLCFALHWPKIPLAHHKIVDKNVSRLAAAEHTINVNVSMKFVAHLFSSLFSLAEPTRNTTDERSLLVGGAICSAHRQRASRGTQKSGQTITSVRLASSVAHKETRAHFRSNKLDSTYSPEPLLLLLLLCCSVASVPSGRGRKLVQSVTQEADRTHDATAPNMRPSNSRARHHQQAPWGKRTHHIGRHIMEWPGESYTSC